MGTKAGMRCKNLIPENCSFRKIEHFIENFFYISINFSTEQEKWCRANALPGTIVRLDHPDRNDIVFGVDGR